MRATFEGITLQSLRRQSLTYWKRVGRGKDQRNIPVYLKVKNKIFPFHAMKAYGEMQMF
jgi:hypothetical protein